MASSTIRVWLPARDSVDMMGGLPDGMVADVWTGGERLPDSVGEVEVVVLPFGVPASSMPVLAKLPKLRLIQLMSAGAENAIPYVPAGHPLWSAPGLMLTPHVAGATTQAIPRAMAIVKDQLVRYAAGEPLHDAVGAQGY